MHNQKLLEIAVYGKGGIGKSTISANLSAALAKKGRSVLQIGCDPKHDSTRLLLNGRQPLTVLDYMKGTGPADYDINEVLFTGYHNIGCIEAGGPEPGVGCAGRGIITSFELLDRFRVKDNYDLVVYDVLGDVVCGGFAVPIRQEYANVIFIVSSGEYMSLYAANNILRGIKNYDTKGGRTAGIIYNKRNIAGEDERIRRFADLVGLPIVAEVPRSDSFTKAEKANKTVIQLEQDQQLSGVFLELAEKIIEGVKLYEANPVSDLELEEFLLGRLEEAGEAAGTAAALRGGETAGLPGNEKPGVSGGDQPPQTLPVSVSKNLDLTNPNRYLSKNMLFNEPLHGCAFNGALSMAVHIQDAVVIAHSPKSCLYMSYQSLSSSGRRGLFERGALLPVSIAPNLEATDMEEAQMIFGGIAELEDKIKEVKKRQPRAIIVISACCPGIIGDDIDKNKALSEEDIPVYAIKADGNLAGDYLQGMLMCYTMLAKGIIKKNVPVKPNTVNIVFEKVVAKNTNSNFATVKELLARLGIGVNCRFLCETTYDRLENFLSAPLNLLAYKDYTGVLLEEFFKKEYGCRFLSRGFPVGFDETREWLDEVAAFFGCRDEAGAIIREHEARYSLAAARLKLQLAGKKLMVVTYNHELDWVIRTAADTGIEIVKIGVQNFSQDAGFRTRLKIELNLEENYQSENLLADIERYRPDILLTNYASAAGHQVPVADTIPMCPDAGFFPGLVMAEKWAALLQLQIAEEWRNDEPLFNKYNG